MGKNEKKQLITFIAVAYGMIVLMSIFMFIGLKGGRDLTAFVNTMMGYPACGVMLGLLIFSDKEKPLPRAGFIVFIATVAIMFVVSILSVFLPETMIESAVGQVSNWNLYTQYVLMAGSVVTYIMFWVCGKEKRKNAGLSRNNIKLSIFMVVLFIVLYIFRIYLNASVSELVAGNGLGVLAEINKIVFNPTFAINAVSVIITFPLSYLAFLGEEYGWRYYFQPVLQKKFGLRLGVVILGLLWGVWHLAADFMFYTTTTGPQYLVSQIINCISLAIFFGYAYMKTHNIWAIAMMHYINNNFIVLLSGGDVNVLQNQSVSWMQLPLMVIMNLVFILFIFSPVYNKKPETDDAETKTA
ncbi:MAG: CPBP family intramembrane metalloprotease [Butyrivibrio sp.]|nr:CPBP family intramembrane metalloprotease [Butyrivibrio sp.]